MNKLVKKLIALSSAGAIMTMSLSGWLGSAQAAAVTLTPSTSEVTLNTATDINVDYTTAAVFTNGDAIKITVKDNTGALIGSALSAHTTPDTQATNAADGAFGGFGNGVATYTISSAGAGTSVSLGFKLPALAKGVYTVTVAENRVNGTNEAFGSVQINVDNANDVAVTANVEPILSMALSNNAIDLGVLTDTAVATATNTLTLKTNAAGGYVVSVLSSNGDTPATAGLWNATADAVIPAAAVGSAGLTAGTSAFGIKGVATTDNATGDGTVTIHENFDADNTSDVAVTTSAQTFASSDGTTAGDVLTTTYTAAVSAVQEAGNYANTVTYTVTGTF